MKNKIITQKDCEECATGNYYVQEAKKELIKEFRKIIFHSKCYCEMCAFGEKESCERLLRQTEIIHDLNKLKDKKNSKVSGGKDER